MPTPRCTPRDRTIPPVASLCPLSSTMWRSVTESNASVPWRVSCVTQSYMSLVMSSSDTPEVQMHQSHHVQRYKCMCPVTSCSDTPEVQMHVPSHVMFRHSRGTNACAQSRHVQTLQRYKCMCLVASCSDTPEVQMHVSSHITKSIT